MGWAKREKEAGKLGEEKREAPKVREKKKKKKKKEKERKEEASWVFFFVIFFSHLEGDIKFSTFIFNNKSICVTLTLMYFINEFIFFLTKFIVCFDLFLV